MLGQFSNAVASTEWDWCGRRIELEKKAMKGILLTLEHF